MTAPVSPSPPPSPTANPHPLVRVDAIALRVSHADPDGTRYEVRPAGALNAASRPALPLFAPWLARGALVVSLRGQCSAAFDAQIEFAGARAGAVVSARVDAATGDFALEIAVPLAELPRAAIEPTRLSVVISPGLRSLGLLRLRLLPVKSAPSMAVFELRDATDASLYDAPERKLFDLQNPEEGFWVGTGVSRLKLEVEWSRANDPGFSLAPRFESLSHNHFVAGDGTDALFEDESRRVGAPRSATDLYLNTSHPVFRGRVPPEGIDVPIRLDAEHALEFAGERARLSWSRDVPLRLRDPLPLLHTFKRLSPVGIDFGTTATVAAFTHRGFRSLMRLGTPPEGIHAAENPTYLLIDDHERLWAEMALRTETAPEGSRRFPSLVGLVQASHLAKARMGESPNAVVGEIKTLPERVTLLDQSPQLRDRARHADFILDESRVRALIRTYAYVLGRAINRPGQDVFLQYWLTYPAQFDERLRQMVEQEIRAGILLSIPEGIPASEVMVDMRATEPEAYAAEVCPELVNHPEIEAVVSKHGEMRFAVFDFGGGTLDVACGRYRPATETEQAQSGCSSVIETLQVGGNDHLGGEYLTHELAWLVHQHESVLPEMEAREVPMQRPPTVPENKLARKPQLYKRSLAGRQNRIRFERDLGLEALKFKRDNQLARPEAINAARLDGSEVKLESPVKDPAALRPRLTTHLDERIGDGAKLLASMLKGTAWGAGGNWRDAGVIVLLAGNSSRSEYVANALGKALGVEGLKVWRPGDSSEFQGVVLYETPTRSERGVEVLGTTPKTAVALGALKIANREVHLVRAAQGFSYYVGDMKGFPPKFNALIPMGTTPANPNEWGPHYVDFGTWESQKPLRVSTEFEPGKMTSNDPRLLSIPTGLPPGTAGKLYVCVISPSKLSLHLALGEEGKFVRAELNLAPYLG